MLSARSEAEFCRNEAARLAAMSRRRASCRCLSGRSRDFSLVITLFCRTVFFGTGAGAFRKKRGELQDVHHIVVRHNPSLTFFSGLSMALQLLFLICCSWSNFMVTSSMESCRRSQNPARSWEVGRGMALGSCERRDDVRIKLFTSWDVMDPQSGNDNNEHRRNRSWLLEGRCFSSHLHTPWRGFCRGVVYFLDCRDVQALTKKRFSVSKVTAEVISGGHGWASVSRVRSGVKVHQFLFLKVEPFKPF